MPDGTRDAREAPSRAILEDRYAGRLMRLKQTPRGMVGDYNGLQERMDAVLWDLMDGTLRRQHDDDDDALVGELQRLIRERVVTWALQHPEPIR